MGNLAKFFKSVWRNCGRVVVDTAIGLPGNILGDALSDVLQGVVDLYRVKKSAKGAASAFVCRLSEEEAADKLFALLDDIADECGIKAADAPAKRIEALCQSLMDYMRGKCRFSAKAMRGFLSQSKTYKSLDGAEKEIVQQAFYELRSVLLDEQFKSLTNESRDLYHCIAALIDPEDFAQKVAKSLLSAGGGTRAVEIMQKEYSFAYIRHECPRCHAEGKNVSVAYDGGQGKLVCAACGTSYTIAQNLEAHLSEASFKTTLETLAQSFDKKIDWSTKTIVDKLDELKSFMEDGFNKIIARFDKGQNSSAVASPVAPVAPVASAALVAPVTPVVPTAPSVAKNVPSVTKSASVAQASAADSTDVLEFELENGTYTVTGLKDRDVASVVIPSQYNGVAVTRIGESAFNWCTNLATVTFGANNQLTSIGERAFYYCTGLTSITIPDSVTSIGEEAFYGCTSLKSITIPDGVVSIGGSAFYNCTNLATVTFGADSKLTSIGEYAFYYCTALTSITIPDGVTSIGRYAFWSCTNLTIVTCNTTGWWVSTDADATSGTAKVLTAYNLRSTYYVYWWKRG